MTARLPLKGETGENRWCKAKGSKAWSRPRQPSYRQKEYAD